MRGVHVSDLFSRHDVSREQSRGATDTGGSHAGGRSLLSKKKVEKEKKIFTEPPRPGLPGQHGSFG